MSLTAGSIIDQARGVHRVFDLTRHPNKVVLQFLSRYAKELHGRIAAVDPDAVREDVVTNLPLADHAAGIALPENRMVVEATGVDARNTQYPIDVIPATHRNDRGIRWASAWQIGAVLYLMSPATAWSRITSIAVAIVPTPDSVTTLGSALALPDAAENVLVEQTAAFMARRHAMEADPKAPRLDLSVFMGSAKDAEAAYLKDVVNRLSGQLVRTRDVYDP